MCIRPHFPRVISESTLAELNARLAAMGVDPIGKGGFEEARARIRAIPPAQDLGTKLERQEVDIALQYVDHAVHRCFRPEVAAEAEDCARIMLGMEPISSRA